jgi:hypothetical protein
MTRRFIALVLIAAIFGAGSSVRPLAVTGRHQSSLSVS